MYSRNSPEAAGRASSLAVVIEYACVAFCIIAAYGFPMGMKKIEKLVTTSRPDKVLPIQGHAIAASGLPRAVPLDDIRCFGMTSLGRHISEMQQVVPLLERIHQARKELLDLQRLLRDGQQSLRDSPAD